MSDAANESKSLMVSQAMKMAPWPSCGLINSQEDLANIKKCRKAFLTAIINEDGKSRDAASSALEDTYKKAIGNYANTIITLTPEEDAQKHAEADVKAAYEGHALAVTARRREALAAKA